MTRENSHLFVSHSEAEICRWARGLHLFRLCLPTPVPHANDGERFLAALRFAGENDLGEVMRALGIVLKRLAPAGQRPTTVDQPSRIPGFPHLAQPGHQSPAGVPAFVWVSGGTAEGVVEVTIADPDDPYVVSERAFQGARAVETLLLPQRQRIIDPPLDHRVCVCPKYYPELWRSTD